MYDKFQVHLDTKSKPNVSNHLIDFYLKLYVARCRMLHWCDLSIACFGIQVIPYGHIMCMMAMKNMAMMAMKNVDILNIKYPRRHKM